MKAKTITAAAAVCVAGLVLAGCNQQQANNEPTKAAEPAGQAAPQPAQAADISPESNQKFLAENAKKPGVKVTADGLQYRVIKAGGSDDEIARSCEEYIEQHLLGFAQGHERLRAIEQEALHVARQRVHAALNRDGRFGLVTREEEETMVKEMAQQPDVRREATRRVDDVRSIARSAHDGLVSGSHDDGEDEA